MHHSLNIKPYNCDYFNKGHHSTPFVMPFPNWCNTCSTFEFDTFYHRYDDEMRQYQKALFEMHQIERALRAFAMTSADKAAAVATLGELTDKIELAIEEAKQITEVWNDVTVQVNLHLLQTVLQT